MLIILLTTTTAVLANLCPVAATTPALQSTLHSAKSVLDSNWVHSMNSTLPSPQLYPHQWSWDASFIALGYSHYFTLRAIAETEALFSAQWSNGLLPHIVFNPSTEASYFPGPSVWNTHVSPHAKEIPTSGIVQPPVHAIASLAIFRNARTTSDRIAAKQHLFSIFPKLQSWHNYLYNNRDPANEGLVYIRHMWESGMDNSPAWDAALEAIVLSQDEIPSYTRVDKGKVGNQNERPTTFFYDRAVYLINLFYQNRYDEAEIFRQSPFLVQDVLFNAILANAGEALADIANILGLPEEAEMNRKRAEKTAKAITAKLYDPEERFFFDYDLVANRLIRRKISGGFVALFGAAVDQSHVGAMVEHLYSPGFLSDDLSSWTIPSVSKEDPGYTNTTYWKGPAWLNINYLVREGLLKNANGNAHAERIAEYLKERSIEMINSAGFFEYFNPISGSPHGGHQFSWSAALVIDWICSGESATDVDSPLRIWNVLCSTTVLGVLSFFVGYYLNSANETASANVKDEEKKLRRRKPLRGETSLSVRRGATTPVLAGGSLGAHNRRSA